MRSAALSMNNGKIGAVRRESVCGSINFNWLDSDSQKDLAKIGG